MTDDGVLLVTLTVADLRDIVRGVVATTPPRYYSQNDSPLGKRRHLDLVKRGELTGYIEGRRILVLSEDVHAYIERERAPGPRVVSRAPRTPRAHGPAPEVSLPPGSRRVLASLTQDGPAVPPPVQQESARRPRRVATR
jgi:hypothetical protein